MNDKERQMYEAILKIERNIDILDYVHDSITEGCGKVRYELFNGAVLEIILNIRESINIMSKIITQCDAQIFVTDSETWQFNLYKYLTNNKITTEQYLKICDVLGISISELN